MQQTNQTKDAPSAHILSLYGDMGRGAYASTINTNPALTYSSIVQPTPTIQARLLNTASFRLAPSTIYAKM